MNAPTDHMLEIIDESIKNDPRNPHLWLKKGNMLLERKDFDKANSCLDRAISLGPKIPSIIEAKGNYHTQIGDHSTALKWFDQLITLTPKEVNGWNLKAKVLHHQMDEHTDALKCYYQILDLKPQISSTYKHIADVFLKLNNKADAIKFYKQYLSLHPYDDNAKGQLTRLNVPIEEDYSQYLPIKYFSKTEFEDRFGFQPPDMFYNLLEAAYYEFEPSTFYNTILGCDIYPWFFKKDGKLGRPNGEPQNFYSIFSKIHNQSFGILKTHNGEMFSQFNGEEGTVNILTKSVTDGLEYLYQNYLEYTLSNISDPEVFITALLNDRGTQTLFYILDKELTFQNLIKYKKEN